MRSLMTVWALVLFMLCGLVNRSTVSQSLADELGAVPPVQDETAPAVSDGTGDSPEESGEIQERGVLDKLKLGATRQFEKLQFQAPTANLTLVANALRLKRKSLTTLVTVDQNLAVSQPVEISVGYYSPAGTNRITQSYVRSSGNRFLYHDKVGDGKPRTMTISITLREPKEGGGYEHFAVNWQAFLDPLYDVTIGPFNFDLISNCDFVGKSEILFTWRSPDSQYHKHRFSIRGGSRTIIPQFAWSRSEVSWSHPLFLPDAHFFDEDNLATEMLWTCLPAGCGFRLHGSNDVPLLSGTTGLRKGNLEAHNDSCQAYFEYKMTKTLRFYSYLEP